MTFLLSNGVVLLLHAQTLPSGAPAFKAGDYVDVQMFSQWLPCKVVKPVLYGAGGQCQPLSATCSTVRAYTVTCIVNPTSGPQESDAALTDVRARVATAGDKNV